MKKEYISPTMVMVELDTTDQILESSYTDIGGTTDTFGAKKDNFIDDEFDEDF